jgi:GntR family transcriptional repressor for pyruvate dehydrogenase complex
MIEPITRTNVVDQVFDTIMRMIASREWTVGYKIPSENEMKARFKVSRNSIRQAIHRVAALGLLESKQGEGTYVRKIDLSFYLNILVPVAVLGTDDALMLFHLQRAIQVESAQQVCEFCNDEQAEKLLAYVEQMKRGYSAGDKIGYLTADLDYHALFVAISHNQLFVKLTEIIRQMLYYTLRDVVFHFDCTRSINFHEDIAMAVKHRDRSTVLNQMKSHMDHVIMMISELSKRDQGAVANERGSQGILQQTGEKRRALH